ncbi:MAG: hypothetical protein SFV55_25290 [Haliscomenobacter sp.]|uniref:hypothetical protein n=1 Tax=Haliscomenobacter sp. TaxID=2717303 RepID=UPI0029A16824|nr:hypothetical protein [Haliscomenobacter sp.]MDX2071772.1 hypothetical protein [Haliscomenobacter sp.]
MQLKKIQEALDQFKTHLASDAKEEHLYIYESQKIFQENWNLESSDLASMYNRSLNNTQTRRLWNREHYEPKRMMLEFWRMQPDFVKQMFLDLFDENKKVDGRVGRFVFYCDELLTEFLEKHPRSRESKHFHQDGYQIVSLYLAFRYPNQYSLYHFDRFKRLLIALGTPDIPATHDFDRFCKVVKTLWGFMQKDEELMAAHRERLEEGKHFQGESLLPVYELIQII